MLAQKSPLRFGGRGGGWEEGGRAGGRGAGRRGVWERGRGSGPGGLTQCSIGVRFGVHSSAIRQPGVGWEGVGWGAGGRSRVAWLGVHWLLWHGPVEGGYIVILVGAAASVTAEQTTTIAASAPGVCRQVFESKVQ